MSVLAGPRAQGQIVAVSVLTDARPTGRGDDAVKGPHLIMRLDLDRGMGADKRVEVQIVAHSEGFDAILEKVVEMIAAVETQKG